MSRIDLVITDVGLPGGMNGRQMVDAARPGRADLKVLFITGYAENAAIGNGHLEPGMHVLTKPFAMEKLAARIKAVMADKPGLDWSGFSPLKLRTSDFGKAQNGRRYLHPIAAA